MSETLVLIDGHSLMFRAFYGMPLAMTGPGGVHTNAVYGFLTILNKVIETEKPDYLAVAFDLAAPTFRHRLYPDYKGNRSPAPEEFHEQIPIIRELLADMQVPVISCEGWEADDVLGTLAAQAASEGVSAEIVSGDRDLLQVADDHICIILPRTKGGNTTYDRFTPKEVEAAYGVTPTEFIDVKALMGDTSDNVPGLAGVGPKTAEKIIQQFGSVENAHAHVSEVKPKRAMEGLRDHYADVLLSKDLVTIRKNAPVSFDRESFRLGDLYTEAAYEAYQRLGFKSLLGHFEKKPSEKKEKAAAFADITTEAAAEAAFSGAEGTIGVSCVADRQRVWAYALATKQGVSVFRTDAGLPEKYLKEKLLRAITESACTASMHCKELLKQLPEAEGAPLFDNVIAAYLVNPLKSDWSYDAISSAYLKETCPSEEELIGKKGLAAAASGPDFADQLVHLAGYEADVARRSVDALRQALSENEETDLFEKIEMPLVPVLASMERAGILASREELKRYGDSLSSRIGELESSIYEEAGETFNINSPKQLGVILFEKMKLPGGRKTKTGYSTAADVLEKLAPEHPIVADILEYRMLTKLKSTYADGLPAYIGADGRIRTTFHQTITATGRLSSTDPNLQNIPMREELGRLIRKSFYPADGCVFVDADYSQIELRILAHMSGDEKLIEAYKEAKDIHRITASQVFHVPFDEVTDELRRRAKAVNFGIVYGISAFGLSEGLSIPRKEAADYINRYFETYPGIHSFLEGLVNSAKEKGYAVSLYGRRRPVPELRESNFARRSFGERVAMNSPIQGTAADIIKIAMVRVYRRLKAEKMQARLILQIHDELLVEAPESEAEKTEQILREEMQNAAKLKVVLEADCHIGKNWYEAK